MVAVFPFSAIVSQERMKRALLLNAVSPQIGGVLIRGERGTAKSTAARALAALLPQIEVVADCPFHCDPTRLKALCDLCRERVDQGAELPTSVVRTSFVDLPISATEDRVVGTLDLERAIKQGERRFEPGILAAANRGLLYVDEVNLLDDHVVDLLLDAAAMGVNIVEREGISFSHPAQFILVGTMNPEEGELRPQLLDRFALCVDIQGIASAEARMEIIQRRVAYERDPDAFHDEWSPVDRALSQRIAAARQRVGQVAHTQDDLYTIAELTAAMEIDGHRADIVILKAALAQAAFDGRQSVTEADILLAAELALPHRLRRLPFDGASAKLEEIHERIERLRSEDRAEMGAEAAPQGAPEKKTT